MSNIYLVGMMGSGKTVTGRHLAVLLNYGFVDLDENIQDKLHRTISDIFEKEGEPFFRKEEAGVLKEVSGIGRRVIATGGGTVLLPENVTRMKSTGKVVYLETSLELLWQRVRGKKDRPLLKQSDPRQSLEMIFAARRPLYEQA